MQVTVTDDFECVSLCLTELDDSDPHCIEQSWKYRNGKIQSKKLFPRTKPCNSLWNIYLIFQAPTLSTIVEIKNSLAESMFRNVWGP